MPLGALQYKDGRAEIAISCKFNEAICVADITAFLGWCTFKFLMRSIYIVQGSLHMHPANERQWYIVMMSLIGWAHTQKIVPDEQL